MHISHNWQLGLISFCIGTRSHSQDVHLNKEQLCKAAEIGFGICMSVMHTGVHVTCCSTGLLMRACFCVLHVDGLCHVDFVLDGIP